MSIEMGEGLLNLREVSIILSRSESSLRADIQAGRLRGVRIGKGSYRVARSEIARILAEAGAIPTHADMSQMKA
jgi:hypothetical protein